MNEGLNTLSAADVAAVTRNNDGNMWGDGGWFWIIILAFLFCGNGWGNNNGAQDAFISDEFVKRDIFNTNQNVSNTACETQRDVLENRYNTQLGLQNLQAQQAQCCCNTQKEILQSRYDAALQAQNMQAQMAQCLKRFFKAIRNLFTKKSKHSRHLRIVICVGNRENCWKI